jgi:hypothetical protein
MAHGLIELDLVFKMKKQSFGFILCCILIPFSIVLIPEKINAQKQEINSEYRLTVVPTYALSKKLFLTTYLGYVNNTGTNTTSYYIGLPFIATYKPNEVVELMAGAFLVVNKVKGGTDNNEFRPLIGAKLTLPNTNNLHVFNWTRYEYRSFKYEDKTLNNVKNRIRNRIAIEFPLSKNAWQPKSWYALSDFEFFYTFEKGYFDRFRQRFGVGYVLDKQWKAEFIYHIQMLRDSQDHNPEWTDNIFRLNMKWAMPHKHNKIQHKDQLDMDD